MGSGNFQTWFGFWEVTYNQCTLYMVLPALILILLTLWMDGQFQRVLRMTCRCRCRCNLWGILLAILIKAAAIGLLWVVSVLLDGDWYVCYQRAMLPCKNNTDDTPYQEELEKQLETHFKRKSMVYGLVLVLVLLFATSILTAIPWTDICSILTAGFCRVIRSTCSKCKCSKCSNCCRMDCKIKPFHRALFEENIREQTEILIGNDFKTTAKECVVLESRKLLQPSSNAVPLDTTTQGGGGASSSSTRPEVEDSRSSTTRPEVEDSRSSTTRPEVEDSRSSTTRPEVEDSRSSSTRPEVEDSRSSTTRPEVEDRVITLDNLDFDKISDLHSRIIRSLFPEPPSSAAPATPQQPTQGEDGPSSNIIV
ncbi:unnamed protein product [Coregonus sp. 'balchen']|nr:unnamed protein product [Coregonus sp. 'balchen']